jgi:hypothetical protein
MDEAGKGVSSLSPWSVLITNQSTVQLSTGTAEFGATWFHGVIDNPVYQFAVQNKVVEDITLDPGSAPGCACTVLLLW